jgi:hypothetical protein
VLRVSAATLTAPPAMITVSAVSVAVVVRVTSASLTIAPPV